MTDSKISQLTDGGEVLVTDEFVAVRSGANVRVNLGRIQLEDGASGAGNLACYFASDTDTGFYRNADNEMTFEANGASVCRIGAASGLVIANTISATSSGVQRNISRDLKLPYQLAISGAASSVTGTTSETALATISIPANAIGTNGMIMVYATFSCTVSANTKTFRIRFGGVSGTVYKQINSTSTTATHLQVCGIFNANSATSQKGLAPSNNAALTGGNFTSALPASSEDTTSAVDLVISGQLGDAGETITLESYRVEIAR